MDEHDPRDHSDTALNQWLDRRRLIWTAPALTVTAWAMVPFSQILTRQLLTTVKGAARTAVDEPESGR